LHDQDGCSEKEVAGGVEEERGGDEEQTKDLGGRFTNLQKG